MQVSTMGEAVPYVRKTKRRPSITKRAKITTITCGTMAVALTFGGLYLKQQETIAANAEAAARYTPEAVEPVAGPEVQGVAVIGDSYVGGSDMGGVGATNWTAVAEKLVDAQTPTAWSVEGIGGAGYVNPGPSGRVFGQAIGETVNPTTDVIVFFGSRNDAGASPDEIAAAASADYDAALAIAPEAKLVVVGPPWVDENPPASLTAINTALAEVVAAKSGTYINALDEGWFNGENAALIGTDGVHPTDEGHAQIAEILAPKIAQAIS